MILQFQKRNNVTLLELESETEHSCSSFSASLALCCTSCHRALRRESLVDG